jgi:hypothetical protein
MDTGAKVQLILGSYVQLSPLLTSFREGYRIARVPLLEHGVALPSWDLQGTVSPLSVRPVLGRVARDLKQLGPGDMFFVHVLFPHYPYVYQRDCELRPEVKSWQVEVPLRGERRNTTESRARGYPKYLDQVSCTQKIMAELFASMKESGSFDEAIIVVHGDHGSRLDRGPPIKRLFEQLESSDYVDAYATLFAVKKPGLPARYDRRMIPIDQLFATAILGDRYLDENQFTPPTVFISAGFKFLMHEMPAFGYGVTGGDATVEDGDALRDASASASVNAP